MSTWMRKIEYYKHYYFNFDEILTAIYIFTDW